MSPLHGLRTREERATGLQWGPPDVRTLTSSGTVDVEDGLALLDTSSNFVTATLPSAQALGIGAEYAFVQVNVPPLTTGGGIVAAPGSETINGAASYQLSRQYESIRVQSDGSNWVITGGNVDPAWTMTDVQTANYDAAFWDYVRIDGSGGGFNVNLPKITASSAGIEVHVQEAADDASNNVVIRPASGDDILGSLASLSANDTAFLHRGLVSDGDNSWWLMS